MFLNPKSDGKLFDAYLVCFAVKNEIPCWNALRSAGLLTRRVGMRSWKHAGSETGAPDAAHKRPRGLGLRQPSAALVSPAIRGKSGGGPSPVLRSRLRRVDTPRRCCAARPPHARMTTATRLSTASTRPNLNSRRYNLRNWCGRLSGPVRAEHLFATRTVGCHPRLCTWQPSGLAVSGAGGCAGHSAAY